MTYDWLYLYCFIFASGLTAALALTPVFQLLAVKLDFMDRPKGEAHKVQLDRQQLEYRGQGKGGGQAAGKDKTI